MPRLLRVSGTALALVLALAAVPTVASANDELLKLQKDPNQWTQPAGDYANTRYSALKQIDTANVKNLQVAWTFSTGVLRGHEGGPLVIGDMMYIHAPFRTRSTPWTSTNNGKIVWKYEPKQDPNVIPVMCCDTVNRGVAYGEGMIFLHQADTTLVALDAKTGKVAWSAKDGDATKGETGTSAPLVVKNLVLIGNSGGEFGVRGHISAYDIKTGKRPAGPFDGPGRRYADGPGEDHRCWASRWARIPASPPGRATSGRSGRACCWPRAGSRAPRRSSRRRGRRGPAGWPAWPRGCGPRGGERASS